MLIYPLTYAYTCKDDDYVLARNRMLGTFYFGDVYIRGEYTNTCCGFQKQIDSHFEMEQGDEEILKQGTVDFIVFSYYFSQIENVEEMEVVEGNIAKDGTQLAIDSITVTTDADGANGAFSYGGSATTNNSSSDGTTVNISNSKITTTGDDAGGIITTGRGITNATNLEINTSGISSGAIRSNRGDGTVNVSEGTYTTTGTGSPTIYSTSNTIVKNATLIAKASEGIVIEGTNSVSIDNFDLTDNNTELNGKSTAYKNIFLYQSMSGDAVFTANNSSITTNNGYTFYITNTIATINLENNNIINNDSNGGTVTINMTNQEATGDIAIDDISTLDMPMSSNNYQGIINGDNSAKSIALTLDSDSTITLIGDSNITSLKDTDSSYNSINFNCYKLYVNGVEIN